MNQMDLPGRAHKKIRPELLTFTNEVKITRTKTDAFLNKSQAAGAKKLENEFDINQEK